MDRTEGHPIPEPASPVVLEPRPPRGPVRTHLPGRAARERAGDARNGTEPRPPADPDWPAGNVVRGLD
ncbi:hypothetical protein [Streptomyces sp. NPDC007088]|uniref:hypothetical protein n=1 Tax=Streptomyces sp. NPDC007088 TaxID=3364773 RepID=UPI0036C2741F